jgi:hypothetical protein
MNKGTFTVSTTTRHAYERWGFDQPITPEMQTLMDSVTRAIDAGLFYTTDVYAAVLKDFDFTAEEIARNPGTTRVQNGVLGMDIYYARRRVEAQREAIAEQEARERLRLEPGMKFRRLCFSSGHARHARNVMVKEVASAVLVEFTAGNRRYSLSTSARSIENAKRIVERDRL